MTDTPVESYESRLMREINATVALANDGFGSVREHPEASCGRCGRPNVWSWHTPSPLWNAVMRDRKTGADAYSIVCPPCFAELAEPVIGKIKITWCFKPHDIDMRALWVDGDGREWNGEQCLWVARPEIEGATLSEESRKLITAFGYSSNPVNFPALEAIHLRLLTLESELAAIKARAEFALSSGQLRLAKGQDLAGLLESQQYRRNAAHQLISEDIPALLLEVERLSADRDRLNMLEEMRGKHLLGLFVLRQDIVGVAVCRLDEPSIVFDSFRAAADAEIHRREAADSSLQSRLAEDAK